MDEGYPFFFVKNNLLCMQVNGQSSSVREIDLPQLHGGVSEVTACAQFNDKGSKTVLLCFVIDNNGKYELYTSNITDACKVSDSGKLDAHYLKKIFTLNSPVKKLSVARDGIFVSSQDGALHYCDIARRGNTAFTFIEPDNSDHTALLGASSGNEFGGVFDEIVAAKDAFAGFLTGMCGTLPGFAESFEKKIAAEGKALFARLGSEIKTQQKKLSDIFDKPLSDFLNHDSQNKLFTDSAGANRLAAAADVHRVKRLFFEKLEIGRYFDPFSGANTFSRTGFAEPGAVSLLREEDDPFEQLGSLFGKFSSLLDTAKADSLTALDVDTLLEHISGNQPFSGILNDCFNIFKIDEAMDMLLDVFGKGDIHSLLGKLKLPELLGQPADNSFFETLYSHYFPGKNFTILELISFVFSILSFIVFEAQGKGEDFSGIFKNKECSKHFSDIPGSMVSILNGNDNTCMVSAAAGDGAPWWRTTPACSIYAFIFVMIIGILCVLNFGTGIIASSVSGAVAGAVGLCLANMIRNDNTSQSVSDLVAGFAGGFTGSFLATLIGNKAFAGWAQNVNPPTARIMKLKFIMIGSCLILGAGGGAVTSVLVKNYMLNGKIGWLDDWVTFTAGAAAGLGGGAMGCGLHFMGGISGSSCLPVPLTCNDARVLAHPVIIAVLTTGQGLPALNYPMFRNAFMGVYKTELNDPAPLVIPHTGRSLALVKEDEFTDMDNGIFNRLGRVIHAGYIGQRERLFWLDTAGADQVDLLIGVHGIGRYVFPCLSHNSAAGRVNYTRPMTAKEFADFLSNDPWVTAYLNNIRVGGAVPGRTPKIKLSICFSALPPWCCSVGRVLAKRLNAITYAGRPPVIPWLTANGDPVVPSLGGWVKYDP